MKNKRLQFEIALIFAEFYFSHLFDDDPKVIIDCKKYSEEVIKLVKKYEKI